MPSLTVTLCLGSSCFSRGGAANLAALKKALSALTAHATVDVRGQLCRGECTDGPTLLVDGRRYGGVRPEDIPGILARHLPASKP